MQIYIRQDERAAFSRTPYFRLPAGIRARPPLNRIVFRPCVPTICRTDKRRNTRFCMRRTVLWSKIHRFYFLKSTLRQAWTKDYKSLRDGRPVGVCGQRQATQIWLHLGKECWWGWLETIQSRSKKTLWRELTPRKMLRVGKRRKTSRLSIDSLRKDTFVLFVCFQVLERRHFVCGYSFEVCICWMGIL